MTSQEASYQAFELDRTNESSTSLNQPFVLREISGVRPQRKFDNFEQVMDFLLNELLGGTETDNEVNRNFKMSD